MSPVYHYTERYSVKIDTAPVDLTVLKSRTGHSTTLPRQRNHVLGQKLFLVAIFIVAIIQFR